MASIILEEYMNVGEVDMILLLVIVNDVLDPISTSDFPIIICVS